MLFKYHGIAWRTLLRGKVRALSATIPCHLAAVNEYDGGGDEGGGERGDRREGSLAEETRSRKTVSRWRKQGTRGPGLHNAQPPHRRPAKPRLATRLWKI